jgi:hypothetical protein
METFSVDSFGAYQQPKFKPEFIKVETNINRLSISPYILPKPLKKKQKSMESSMNIFPKSMVSEFNDSLITPRCKNYPALRPEVYKKKAKSIFF